METEMRLSGRFHGYPMVLSLALLTGGAELAAQEKATAFVMTWQTVVNNGDPLPFDACGRIFNSYNQPSVNAFGLVVFRARSRGGVCGEPGHGVYLRQTPSGPLQRLFDRSTEVPFPNNLGTRFVEPPSFPRIDVFSNAVATRGNHQPTWEYVLPNGSGTRAGTTGIYTTPGGGPLVTGASKLGGVSTFPFYAVPGAVAGTPFDVFPGAPSITNGSTIVFKGNYTEAGIARTGAYYRNLQSSPAGGTSAVQLIGNSANTKIPGTNITFGSLAPPSAAMGKAVFAGFDNEWAPAAGGIYLVEQLTPAPALKTLVAIGDAVPDVPAGGGFRLIGEGLSFDGRLVSFWAAWGTAVRMLHLPCPNEGNADRRAYCRSLYPSGFMAQVPANQGIFVHDIQTKTTRLVARTGSEFSDFLFWNFSGRIPGMGNGEEGDEGEEGDAARWRSSAFTAVDGLGAASRTLFKAQATSGSVGIYGRDLPGNRSIFKVLDTDSNGQKVDPEAPFGSKVVELGLEREALRNGLLVINVSMAVPGSTEEDSGWAGIYYTVLPRLP